MAIRPEDLMGLMNGGTTGPVGQPESLLQNIVPFGMDRPADDILVEPEEGVTFVQEDPIDLALLKITQDELDELGQHVTELVRRGISARDSGGFDAALLRYKNIFECVDNYPHPGPWKNSSQVVPPDVRAQTETVAARIVDALFSHRPWVVVKPKYPEDEETAQKVAKFIQAEMEAIDLPVLMYMAIMNEEVDGTHLARTSWTRKTRKRFERVVINGPTLRRIGVPMPAEGVEFITYKGKKYKMGGKYVLPFDEITENRFDLEFINVHDLVMFPATAKNFDEVQVIGHVVKMTKEEIRQGVVDGLFDKETVDELEDGFVTTVGSTFVPEAEKEDNRAGISTIDESDTEYGKVPIFVGFTRIRDLDDDGIAEWNDVALYPEMGRFLRFRFNPFHNGKIPYEALRLDRRLHGDFYGYSSVGKSEDLHEEIKVLTRQNLDAGAIALTSIVEVEGGARRKIEDNEFKIGVNWWQADQKGNIKNVHTFPQIPSANFANRDDARRQLQKLVAADEPMQGVQGMTGRTATETTASARGASIRHSMKVAFALQFLTWVYNQYLDYCRQFMEDKKEYFVIRNGKAVRDDIFLEDLSIDCEVQAYSEVMDPDKALRYQAVEKVFTILAQMPAVQQDGGKLYKVIKYAINKFDPNLDLDTIITQEEVEQLVMQMQEQQQQLAEQQATLGSMEAQGAVPQDPGLGATEEQPAF